MRIADRITSLVRRRPPTDEEPAARAETEAVPEQEARDRASEASQAAELERLLGWPVFGKDLERPTGRGPRRT